MKRLLFNSLIRIKPRIHGPKHITALVFHDPRNESFDPSSSPSCSHLNYYQLSQIRFMGGRNDGARFVLKPRPVSKKQQTKYHRKLKVMEEKQAKHSKPGSKAGPRREFAQDQLQYYKDKATGKFSNQMEPEELEYDFGDAILDDLMGNTAHLSSIPNPTPIYLGHKYETYYTVVERIMKEYNRYLTQSDNNEHLTNKVTSSLAPPLPTDYQLSLLLRSYRDQCSTSRSKPLGVAPVLRLLSQDLQVPMIALKELCYTTLMTCATTPTEARRIMKMMKDYNHPITSYSYSILVHIHSRRGDFRGAAEVLSEMNMEGVEPSLAAYTSCLAACYKVCNQGAISQAIKAEAGKLAWEKWKELRIIGLEPDVMTYGAILRIMAARGLPEQAINIIDEMRAANVKPTPLIFSTALKAVARSHANALRFHGGKSIKNKRRELITAHHGKMAKSIVIAADNAHVDQDEGFVSALMLCAATAGDSATVKAIYLASEVRKLDSLRLIGGEEHLRLLQGGQGKMDDEKKAGLDLYQSSKHEISESRQNQYPSYEEREYGKDSRKVSVLLYSYAQALESGGLGNMWSGRENKGYLCENSLRLITTRRVPEYVDKSIPGMSGTETGLTSLNWEWADNDLEALSKQERRQTVRKIKEYQDAGNRIDELDPMFLRMHMVDDSDDGDGKDITLNKSKSSLPTIKPLISDYPKEYKKKLDTTGDSNDDAVKEFEYNLADIPDVNINSFEEFYESLKGEFEEDSEVNVLNEESARELFELISVQQIPTDGDDLEHNDEVGRRHNDSEVDVEEAIIDSSSHDDDDKEEEEEEGNFAIEFDDFNSKADTMLKELNELQENMLHAIKPVEDVSPTFPNAADTDDELSLLLQGFPLNRIEKVRETFSMSLGTPSFLSLVPTVREVMPERICNSWLKKKNLVDAFTAMESVEADIHILNSMLQVLSKSGSIDKALAFYDKEFKAHNTTPTAYSDRLVLQMLVHLNRISRALEFKAKVEAEGRTIDLLSYGSLIEYYGNRGEIGDAIATLKECISIHKTYPGEKSLKQLRLNCRKQGLEGEINLTQLIGQDPLAWLREGESSLKREYSKRGRRYMDYTRNRMLQI